MLQVSHKAQQFTESIIRDMTRICLQHNGINLAQGFPDFPAPPSIKEAAKQAIDADINQYAITWGSPSIRQAIAAKMKRFYGMEINPDKEITVTCGATEAMFCSVMALVNPGEEVIVFEPFYENYGPDAILSGAVPRFVPLREPHWEFDEQELAQAFHNKTKALILNTPNNPTGKVFNREELEIIARLCQKWGVIVITDEIYEHIIYDGCVHIPMATIPGMEDRTVTINGLSKTYSVTGWRIGYIIAPPELTSGIRKVHDFVTVGAAAPLQEAGAFALNLGEEFYTQLAHEYTERRDVLLQILEEAGFRTYTPHGAYYIMTDIGHFGFASDMEFALFLVKEIGVATVPGSSFYHHQELGRTKIRFAFPKKLETLRAAGKKLEALPAKLSTRK